MFDGEAIELHPQRKTEEHFSDDEINEKYVRGEVRIVTEQARYPLVSVPQLLSSGDYLLRPEYQRRHRWSPEKKSRLIESLVMNVPVPPIFLYEYEFSKYEVMDGLQRLSTIHEFYEDRFELQGLAEWPELNGKKYSTLPSSIKAGSIDGICRRSSCSRKPPRVPQRPRRSSSLFSSVLTVRRETNPPRVSKCHLWRANE